MLKPPTSPLDALGDLPAFGFAFFETFFFSVEGAATTCCPKQLIVEHTNPVAHSTPTLMAAIWVGVVDVLAILAANFLFSRLRTH